MVGTVCEHEVGLINALEPHDDVGIVARIIISIFEHIIEELLPVDVQ